MKPKFRPRPNGSAGFLTVELVVAITILTLAILPLAFSFLNQQRALRHAYHRAAALQLVDGEAEVLASGALTKFADGERDYPMPLGAVTNLPPGRFVLRKSGPNGILEWKPAKTLIGGGVRRDFHLVVNGGAR